jgi:RND superfamily putative drug exporter
MSRFLDRLARLCARHPWRTLLGWVVALVVLASIAGGLGGEYADDFRLPNSDAQKAIDQLEESFPSQAGGEATLVYHDTDRTIHDPRVVEAIERNAADIVRLPHVIAVSNPYSDGTISVDGTIAYATVRYDEDTIELGSEVYDELEETVAALGEQDVQVEIGGSLALWEQSEAPASEQIGLLAAVIVLMLAFGSVVAMVLPIGMALFALIVGQAAILTIAATTNVPTSASTLVAMIGLGVGIDYALFIVTRFRELRHSGHTVIDSVGRASATSGVAVLFAGVTVIIAICGLLLSGIWAVGMLGIAAAVVVAVTVVAALTLLPALLGLLGRWVDKLRLPIVGRRQRQVERTLSWRWAHGVTRHPVVAAVVGAATLGALAAPIMDMRLGQNDQGSQGTDTSQRQAYDLLADGFGPGFNGPLLIVATVPDAAAREALDNLHAMLADTPGVVAVSDPKFNEAGDVAVFDAMPTTAPQDKETQDIVEQLRTVHIPAAVAGSSLSVLVSGTTAGNIDLARQLSDRLPLLIGAVVALAFLLLMIAFRSILIPLKAALMNLLSVGAAYGVIVAVFQWGWGKDLIGLEQAIPIVSWVPMLLFAILFGLSMDYEVFLLSRIREEYARTGDTHESVAAGLAGTARVITAAAIIMIAVFLGFVAYPDPVVKLVGLGLAVAVFVDATIVRMLLVPSLMVLMGRANWWLPRWLGRILPKIHLDESEGETRPAGVLPPPTPPQPQLVVGGR